MNKRAIFHQATVGTLNRLLRIERLAAASFAMVGFHDYWTQNSSDEVRFLAFCGSMRHLSRGQILQDLWVLFELNLKAGGYFVEFGAYNGETDSNTKLLESQFNWSGILAEPNPDMVGQLRQDRTAIVDERCVWDSSGQQVELLLTGDAKLSTVEAHAKDDSHTETRQSTAIRKVSVPTVSLNDLLKEYGAPVEFDFLSIDTEGTEIRILETFDIAEFRPRLVAIEHNHRQPDERLIDEFMNAHGYERRFRSMSDWDGWYRLRRD